jgi:hypothetical protein
MSKKDIAIEVAFFGIILTLAALAFIGLYYILTYASGDYNNCFFVKSECLDLTEGNRFNTKIPIETCRNGYACNAYCEKKYKTEIDWVSRCITDGSSPSCINIQACVCQKKAI